MTAAGAQTMITPIRRIVPGEASGSRARGLEAAAVLLFPDLPFPFSAFERRFTERPFADGRAENVSIHGEAAELRGAAGTPEVQASLRRLLIRVPAFTRDPLSDLVMHGAMGGRYMLEQTAYLPVAAQADPDLNPQRILAAKLGRALRT